MNSNSHHSEQNTSGDSPFDTAGEGAHVRPSEIRVRGYAPWPTLDADEQRQVPLTNNVPELEATCGSCKKRWTARQSFTGPSGLRYNETGWISQCPYCHTVNVHDIKK
ncbi:MAG: hypothetical protein GY906_01735 [bacterium]|nr:hypothetical protein [bacterium]